MFVRGGIVKIIIPHYQNSRGAVIWQRAGEFFLEKIAVAAHKILCMTYVTAGSFS